MTTVRCQIQRDGWLRLPLGDAAPIQPGQDVDVRILGDIVVISRPASALGQGSSLRASLQPRFGSGNVVRQYRKIFKI